MKLVDPTIVSPSRQHRRATQLAELHGATIGLLSNGKLNADLLLQETAAELVRRFGGKVLPMKHKKNPSAPAPGELITNLSPECDYLLTAAGD